MSEGNTKATNWIDTIILSIAGIGVGLLLADWQKTHQELNQLKVEYASIKAEKEAIELNTYNIITSQYKISTSANMIIPELDSEVIVEVEKNELVSEEIVYYIAQCVMAEAGNQSELGKRLVADVIINRYNASNCRDYTDIINAAGQFECVSNGSIYTMNPDEALLQLVYEELENPTNLEVYYFRTGHYHSVGKPLFKEGDHYFSSQK